MSWSPQFVFKNEILFYQFFWNLNIFIRLWIRISAFLARSKIFWNQLSKKFKFKTSTRSRFRNERVKVKIRKWRHKSDASRNGRRNTTYRWNNVLSSGNALHKRNDASSGLVKAGTYFGTIRKYQNTSGKFYQLLDFTNLDKTKI